MKKTNSPTRKSQNRSKVVTGSGLKKKKASMLSFTTLRTVILVVFAVSFGLIGYQLLRSSSAEVIVNGPTDVTIATWNSMKDNKKNDATEVKSILSEADVVGLQEIHVAKQRSRITSLIKSSAYDGYPSKLPSNNKASAASYPIIWKEANFSLVKAGKTGQVSKALGDLRPKYITWVKLRSKATGQEFYVVNTHMIKYVDSSGVLTTLHPGNVSRYTGHMQKLVVLLQKLQKDNVPLFLTGDFAVDYRTDDKGTSTFPHAALGNIGLKSNWELTGLSGIAPEAKTYGLSVNYPPRLIDYVFASSDVTNPVTTIAQSNHGSDHYPVYLRVTIAQPPAPSN